MKKQSKSEFFAPVQILDTKDIIQNGLIIGRSDREKAVIVDTPEGERRIVNFASKSYGLHPTADLFGKLEAEMEGKIQYEANYYHEGFSRFFADYTLTGRTTSIGNLPFKTQAPKGARGFLPSGTKADTIAPKIRVMHSYDGMIPFTFQIGMYRQLCTNGLHGYSFQQKCRVRNTINASETIYRIIVDEMQELLESVRNIEVVYNDMSNRYSPNWAERVEHVMQATAFPVRQKEAVIERAVAEAQMLDTPVNDWLLYNAFNYQLNHNPAIRMDEYSRMNLDAKVFAAFN